MMALTEGRLTGRPGDLLRHPGARRDQRRPWRPHRRARLGADDPVHRPGRAGDAGARRVPGDGLSRLLRLGRQMGDGDRQRGADSRGRPARLPCRDAGPARPGGDRAAGGHARSRRRRSPTRPRRSRLRSGRGSTQMAELQKMLWAAERPIAILGGPGWTPRASAAFARFAERFDMPVVGRSAAPAPSTASTTIMPARSAFGPTRNSRRASRTPTSSLLVGGRMSEAAVAGLHAVRHSRAAPKDSSMSTPTRRKSAATIIPRSASSPRRRRSAPRSKAFSRPDDSVVGRDDDRRAPTTSPGARRRRPRPAGCSERDHVRAAAARSGRDLRHRRRQFHHLGQSVPALSLDRAAARADLRIDGLRRAGGDRRRSVFPGRTVVCFSGDGDFLMNGQEFATAVQYGAESSSS